MTKSQVRHFAAKTLLMTPEERIDAYLAESKDFTDSGKIQFNGYLREVIDEIKDYIASGLIKGVSVENTTLPHQSIWPNGHFVHTIELTNFVSSSVE